MSSAAIRVAVVGGGISGLVAAFHLRREAVRHGMELDLTLLEAGNRLGGKVSTVRRDGFLIERGPDSLAADAPPVKSLLEGIGLDRELVRSAAGPTSIYTGRGLHPLPAGVLLGVPTRIVSLITTPLLSPSGKIEALADLISRYPERMAPDESVESFLGRRFGAEFVERVAAPLLEAIHADRVACMSAEAALPGFAALAASRGSLIRMLARSRSRPTRAERARARSKPQSGPFASVRGGLGRVVEAVARELPADALWLDARVDRIERSGERYLLRVGGGRAPVSADAVVLAAPAAAAGQMLRMPFEFEALDASAPATVASVALAFPAAALPPGPPGTGFVAAAGARCAISAATLVHVKWPHAVPTGHALVRCSVDFSRAAAYATVDDTRLTGVVRRDLERILGIKAAPEFALVTRWPDAMPRYAVGHFGRLAALRAQVAERFPGVFLAGASFGGASLTSCVAQGAAAASAAFAHALESTRPPAAVDGAAGTAASTVRASHFEVHAAEASAAGRPKETEPC